MHIFAKIQLAGMVKLTLTEQEEMLMKKVCEIQLKSFERILQGETNPEVDGKLKKHKISRAELRDMISEVVQQYRVIIEKPDSLFGSYSDLLGNFREALDYNTVSLPAYSSLIPGMLTKLDCAIYIYKHRN
ncbi:MAG: hypothetical protein U0X76_03055 [Bacteroidia bacterium]